MRLMEKETAMELELEMSEKMKMKGQLSKSMEYPELSELR
jgi:hypothetical protein